MNLTGKFKSVGRTAVGLAALNRLRIKTPGGVLGGEGLAAISAHLVIYYHYKTFS